MAEGHRPGVGTWQVLATRRVLHSLNSVATFDEPLPATVTKFALVNNLQRQPRAHIYGNYFGNNRARGILVKTSHVLIENNRFENTLGPAIQAYPDGCFWFESASFTNWTARNNIITGVNRDHQWSNDQLNISEFQVGDIIIAACGVDFVDGRPDNCSGASVEGRHLRPCGNPIRCDDCFPFADVSLENNSFTQDRLGVQPHPAATVWGVNGLQLRGNKVNVPPSSGGGSFLVSNSHCVADANVCGHEADKCYVSGCK